MLFIFKLLASLKLIYLKDLDEKIWDKNIFNVRCSTFRHKASYERNFGISNDKVIIFKFLILVYLAY